MKREGAVKNDIEKIDCPVCFGLEESEPCDACNGRGYFLREKQTDDNEKRTIRMKPTGATKEATGHSPLPWYFDELRKEVYAHDKGFVCGFNVSPYMQEHELQVCQADAQLIITAVNERERLREALRHVRAASNHRSLEMVGSLVVGLIPLIDAALNEMEG